MFLLVRDAFLLQVRPSGTCGLVRRKSQQCTLMRRRFRRSVFGGSLPPSLYVIHDSSFRFFDQGRDEALRNLSKVRTCTADQLVCSMSTSPARLCLSSVPIKAPNRDTLPPSSSLKFVDKGGG